jgi:subtilisin family serine protease
MARRSRGTVRSLGLTLSAALAATLAVTPPVSAQQSAQPQAKPAPTVVAKHTVTLVTSDVVELNVLSDGDATATIHPDSDRAHIGYATRRAGEDLYVVPTDAMAMISAGTLDEELFNISALVEAGYDDAASKTIPLIVEYAPSRARAATAALPPGASAGLTLESINARSMRESKDSARAFWNSVSGSASAEGMTAAAAPVERIWLNRKAQANLTESVPQVGAPTAWDAGYDGTGTTVAVLDTGIDATHPDLDGGKVLAAANFSTDTDTVDHHGHGTHVASIVAGTGEGNPAGRKGVAPGAKLISAKVLNAGGSGDFAGIIDGLEWAAAQGADVANMSLGTNAPSDGNDVLVQAIDAISASSDMLVVVAAGNLGSGESTIASPGWADSALTVGAVSKQDALAGFSSRGPRLGDYGIKPDITAPGVDIVAARAAGSTLGEIVDGNYQKLSGTSMAAPHVAGAAAIMAQRFPERGNSELKDTLITSSKAVAGQSVYQQGSGRLDLARATTQDVYASPGTLNLGYFEYDAPKDPVTKTVTYTNDSASELTLDLALAVTDKAGNAAPAGMFSVSQPSVTVPAGGSASVTVTVDASTAPIGLYGGRLVATGGGRVVHTSVGAYLEPEMFDVTVTGISRDGRPSSVISFAELWDLSKGTFETKYFSADSNEVTFRVPPGTYNLAGYLGTADAGGTYALEVAMVSKPQLEVGEDISVTLDARTANPIKINTEQPTAPTTFTLSYHRDFGERNFHSSFTLSPPISRAYAAPTETVTKGNFEFYSRWDLVAPPLEAQVVQPQRIPLTPYQMTNAVPVDGTHDLPVVYVGLGKPEDYAGKDVRGKIALISRGETTFAEKVAGATAAGAWGAVVFNNRPGLLLAGAGNPGEVKIHGFTIDQEPGLRLVELLKNGPLTMRVSGTAVTPYFYDLLLPEKQRVPTSLVYDIGRRNTARIDTVYRADTPTPSTDVRHISRPWPTFSVGFVRDVPRPLDRTYYVSANDTQWWHLAWANAPFDGEFHDAYVSYRPGARLSEDWFGRVSRPGASAKLETQVNRTGNELDLALLPFSDAGGHHGWAYGGDTMSTKLYAGEKLLASTATAPIGTFPALDTPSSYRLEFTGKRETPWSLYGTDTSTTWRFTSKPGEERPSVPQVDYDLDLDRANQARDRSLYTFWLKAGHVPGVNGPSIRKVQAWVSFDDGATWKEIGLLRFGGGSHLAVVKHPKASGDKAAVSLRVTATDSAGNSVDQTLIRAYGLGAGR